MWSQISWSALHKNCLPVGQKINALDDAAGMEKMKLLARIVTVTKKVTW